MGSAELNPNWTENGPITYRALLSRAPHDRPVLSVGEVATLLGVHGSTVRNYTRKGWLFAPDTGGGRVLITRASLEKFLTEGPPSPPESPTPSVPPPPVSRKSAAGFNLDAFRRKART